MIMAQQFPDYDDDDFDFEDPFAGREITDEDLLDDEDPLPKKKGKK